MNSLFLTVLNMSLTGSFAIVAVILLRFCLKRVPKIFSYALWLIVLFRLVCPISFESVISILPKYSEIIPQDIIYQQAPQVQSIVPLNDSTVNQVLPNSVTTSGINSMQIVLLLGEVVWILGIAILMLYSLFSIYKLNHQLKDAIYIKDNIYLAEHLRTPFVLGVMNPKIFIPTNLDEGDAAYILKHEQTHIKRHDPLIKIVSFLVLCIHWFNPLVWVAFILMTKDMEMSCDEAVIREMGAGIKKEYLTTLLAMGKGHSIIGGAPLAFGEGEIKERIKNILNYKRPAFWGTVCLIAAVIVVAIALISNPQMNRLPDDTEEKMEVELVETNQTKINQTVVAESEDIPLYKVMDRICLNVGLENAYSYYNKEDWPSGDALILLCTSQNSKFEVYGCISPEYGKKGIIINNIIDGDDNSNYFEKEWVYTDVSPQIIETGEYNAVFKFCQEGEDGIVEREVYFDTYDTGTMAELDFPYNLQEQLAIWAQEFVDRDAETIIAMSTDKVQAGLEKNELLVKGDGYASFGLYSPWPMEGASYTYTIYNIIPFGDSATIYYVAVTSDPHVTIWEEEINYDWTDYELIITGEKITYYDSISKGAEFTRAYPYGIHNTGIDYLMNGLGETLNKNAKEIDYPSYQRLFAPETALLDLLNLVDDSSMVQVQWQQDDTKTGEINAQITFLEDKISTYIKMVQPYGKDGIWIPQTFVQ